MFDFDAIRTPLSNLKGLRMWAAGWAGDIAWFQFGGPVQRPEARGPGTREVGEYALHLSCPWRWVTSSGFVRADEHSDRSALGALDSLQATYVDAELAADGELILRLDIGDALAIEGMPSSAATHKSECWRLLQPGLNTPHFVVSTTGTLWVER